MKRQGHLRGAEQVEAEVVAAVSRKMARRRMVPAVAWDFREDAAGGGEIRVRGAGKFQIRAERELERTFQIAPRSIRTTWW
jgi:hypothetical protein